MFMQSAYMYQCHLLLHTRIKPHLNIILWVQFLNPRGLITHSIELTPSEIKYDLWYCILLQTLHNVCCISNIIWLHTQLSLHVWLNSRLVFSIVFMMVKGEERQYSHTPAVNTTPASLHNDMHAVFIMVITDYCMHICPCQGSCMTQASMKPNTFVLVSCAQEFILIVIHGFFLVLFSTFGIIIYKCNHVLCNSSIGTSIVVNLGHALSSILHHRCMCAVNHRLYMNSATYTFRSNRALKM